MKNWRITIALFLLYFLFAMLLNSVGTVILQVIHSFDVSKPAASILEAFKDLSIAGASFLVASFLPRIGYRKSMMLAVAIMGVASVAMPLVPGFLTTKLFFMCCGIAFALVKVSVYSSLGLLANNARDHAQWMNMLEGLFMVGVLSGYWLFSAFIRSDAGGALAWLNVYWVLGGGCIAILVLLASSELDESAAMDVASSGADHALQKQGFAVMAQLAAMPLVMVFLVSAFLSVLVEQGITSWLPTFNNEILRLPLSLSVQVTSILAACTAVGRMGCGVLLRKVDWFVLLSVCLACMMLLVLLTLPLTRDIDPHQASMINGWRDAPLAAFIFPLIGLFMAPIYPVINSLVLSALPAHRHAAMTGLIVIFSALGGTTGSLITGFVFAHFSGQTAFYLTLVPLAVMWPVLAQFRRALLRFSPHFAPIYNV